MGRAWQELEGGSKELEVGPSGLGPFLWFRGELLRLESRRPGSGLGSAQMGRVIWGKLGSGLSGEAEQCQWESWTQAGLGGPGPQPRASPPGLESLLRHLLGV